MLWADQDGHRLENALADLSSPLLFGGSQVLIVRRAEALVEASQEAVLRALPALGPAGRLVLVARAIDSRRRLVTACVKAGAAFAFPVVEEAGVVREWAMRLARERGVDLSPGGLDRLLERSGRDLGALAGEIEKLALYVGAGGRVDEAAVDAVVAQLRTHVVEELTDRIAQRDLGGAIRVFRGLMVAGEPPIRVAAFLAANLRRALHAVELGERGARPEEIARRLGMPPWLVARQLRRGPASQLARALETLREVDLDLKSSRPPVLAFEGALRAMIGPSSGPATRS